MGFKSSFEFILASLVHPYCSWYSSRHLCLFWHHLSIHIAHGIHVFIWVHFGIICPSILLMRFKSSFEFILASFVHKYCSWDSSLHLSSFEFILASFVHPYCSWDSSLHLSSFWYHLSIHIAHGIRVFIRVHFGIICPSILLIVFKSSFELILASFVHPYCSWDSSLRLSSFEFILTSFVHKYCSWDSSLHFSSFWHHLSINIAHGIQVFIWVHFGIICPSILPMEFKSSFEFILASFVHPYCSWYSSLHLSSFEFILASFAHPYCSWDSSLHLCSFEFILASFVYKYCSSDSSLHLSSFWHHLSIHIAHGIHVFIWVHFGIICPSILPMEFRSSFEFILDSFVHPSCSWDSSLHLSSFWHHLSIHIAHEIQVFIWVHLSSFWHHLSINIAHGIQIFIWVHFGIICPSILLMGFKSLFEFILASFVHPYCSWDSSLHLSSFWHHLSIHIAHGIRVFIWVNFGIICPFILLMVFKFSFVFILASFVHKYCSWDSSLHLSPLCYHLTINIAHEIQVFIWVHFGIICP